MTTTVAIFDNARDLEKAVERLAAGGFEDTVYDEAIVAGEAGNVGTVSAPDSATGVLLRSVQPNLSPRPNRHDIVRAFRAHLADYRLSEEVMHELYKYFPNTIFRSVIPRTVRLAEAPSFGKSIFHYEPGGKGAKAYERLAREILDNSVLSNH